MAKKRTIQTKKSGITEVQKAVNGLTQPTDPSYRVYKWDAGLRDALKQAREKAGLSRNIIRQILSTYQ